MGGVDIVPWGVDQIMHANKRVKNVLSYCCVIYFLDDLEIAPDFFEYFSATFPILHNDPSLWCISAWHDNGKSAMIQDDPGQLDLCQELHLFNMSTPYEGLGFRNIYTFTAIILNES